MQKIIRATSAPFEYQDGAEVKSKTIVVRYFGRTVKELKEQRLDIQTRAKNNPDEVIWLSETLAKRLHSLDELPEGFDENFEISETSLDEVDAKNLEAIRDAIEKDENPKLQLLKSDSPLVK